MSCVIFEGRRQEITRSWRIQHNELSKLYASPNIIREIKSRRTRWEGNVARKGDKRNANNVWSEKLEGKRQVGRPKRRWKDNIRTDLRIKGWKVVECSHLA
jgi:hypothetical protein